MQKAESSLLKVEWTVRSSEEEKIKQQRTIGV